MRCNAPPQAQVAALEAAVGSHSVFEGRVAVVSPLLRAWAGLAPGEELWYQVQVTNCVHPASGERLYCIAQVAGNCLATRPQQQGNLLVCSADLLLTCSIDA
jgi:hypothetical protein